MDGLEQAAAGRDGNGRWTEGHSGNPAGKPPGTRNRSTLLRQALAEGDDVRIIRALIDAALGGDRMAVRFLADRLLPKEKPRPHAVDFGLALDASTTPEQIFDAALARVAVGELAVEELGLLAKLLTAWRSPFAAESEAEPRPAAPAAARAANPAGSPEFDLKTGDQAAPPRPANRHERRRAAALQRAAARAGTAPPPRPAPTPGTPVGLAA